MIVASFVTIANADCVMCDARRIDDVVHHLLVCAYDVTTSHDVKHACLTTLNRMIDEFNDYDDDAEIVKIVHDKNNELNSKTCLVFDVYDRNEIAAKLIMIDQRR